MGSITEMGDLVELMHQAELEGARFVAEKQSAVLITKEAFAADSSSSKTDSAFAAQVQQSLTMPRRPAWDSSTTAAELHAAERQVFSQWRRQLAALEEDERVQLSPFERNLEIWRQLWRVVERSDLVVQIVDARNPLLFYFPDLERYVSEVDRHKLHMLLINKADFLSLLARLRWARYFRSRGIRFAFFSANFDELTAQHKASLQSDISFQVEQRLHK